jgi:hypothetical protein
MRIVVGASVEVNIGEVEEDQHRTGFDNCGQIP